MEVTGKDECRRGKDGDKGRNGGGRQREERKGTKYKKCQMKNSGEKKESGETISKTLS